MLFVHVPELTSDDLYEIYFLCFMTQYKIARLNKKLSELKPARDVHSCHITNIEPLAP